MNFQLEHIYRLEDECNRLEKSNKHFSKIAFNSRVTKSDKSKELQKELDIIENKIRAQELENNKITQQKNNLNKMLSQEKKKTELLEKDLHG